MKKLCKEAFQASHLKILLQYHKKWKGDGRYYFSEETGRARQWLYELASKHPIEDLSEDELNVIYIHVLFYASSLYVVKALNEFGEDPSYYSGIRFILKGIKAGVFPWNFET